MRSRLSEGKGKPTELTTMKKAEKKPAAEDEWEVRPGGMLVQKAATPSGRVPTIRVKVKHGSIYHEIYISSQATFGELKKEVSAKTGIHPLDQRMLYKDKERDSALFLDAVGVKDKSKLVVEEDLVAQAKRILEQRRTEKLEKVAKSFSAISLEVDKLASKVSSLQGIVVNKGGKVVESDVVNLIELLMNQLVKLDDMVGRVDDGDLKLQIRMQVKRVQKCVETLDVIKAKNAQPRPNFQAKRQEEQQLYQQDYYHYQKPQNQKQKVRMEESTWDIFDSLFVPSNSNSNSTSTQTSSTNTAASTASSTPTTRLDWELF